MAQKRKLTHTTTPFSILFVKRTSVLFNKSSLRICAAVTEVTTRISKKKKEEKRSQVGSVPCKENIEVVVYVCIYRLVKRNKKNGRE